MDVILTRTSCKSGKGHWPETSTCKVAKVEVTHFGAASPLSLGLETYTLKRMSHGTSFWLLPGSKHRADFNLANSRTATPSDMGFRSSIQFSMRILIRRHLLLTKGWQVAATRPFDLPTALRIHLACPGMSCILSHRHARRLSATGAPTGSKSIPPPPLQIYRRAAKTNGLNFTLHKESTALACHVVSAGQPEKKAS